MFSFCKIRGLARAFCQAGCLASANLGGLVPRRAVFAAGSRGWFLFVARSQVWYPSSGKSRGLVPAKAARANRDQAFLRGRGTKSPKLAEIGVPNLEIRHNSKPKTNSGYQIPDLGRWVPNAQSWRDGHQISVPEEEQLIAVTRPEIGLGLRRCRRDDDRGPRPFRL